MPTVPTWQLDVYYSSNYYYHMQLVSSTLRSSICWVLNCSALCEVWSVCQGETCTELFPTVHFIALHCPLRSVKCVSRGQLAQPHKVSRECSSISCLSPFSSTNFWHLVDKVKTIYTSFRFKSVINFMHTLFSTNFRHPFDKIEGEITHVATYISRWFCWENVVH